MSEPPVEDGDSPPALPDHPSVGPPSPTPRPAKRRPFYGWYIVASGWLALLVSYGVMIFAYITYFDSWQQEFDWSRGTLAGSFSAGVLVLAVTSLVVGKLTDLYGARRMMLLGNIVMGMGFLLLRWISEPWQLYGAYVLASAGFAAAGAVTVNALIGRWFERRRGLAVGLTYTGMGVGGVVITQLANLLTTAASWQTSVTVLALLIWGTQLPLSLLVVRSDPYEMGLLPDGRSAAEGAPAPTRGLKRTAVYARLPGWSLGTAASSGRFWVIALLFFVGLTASNGVFVQIQPFMLDLGYSASLAAVIISAIGGLAIFSKFAYGYLSDRVPMKLILLFATSGAAAAPVLFLVVGTLGAPRWLVLLVPLALGIGGTAFSTLVPVVSAYAFGPRHIGAIAGALGSFVLLGMAAGPVFTGVLFDATGSYTIAATTSVAGMALVVALLAFGPSLKFRGTPVPAGPNPAETLREPAVRSNP